MPYVITTRPCAEPPNEQVAVRAEILSRCAVATLDEARATIRDLVVNAGVAHGTTADPITPTGGTIGPLPNGTVIEVQRVAMNWVIGVAEDRGAEFGEDEADADIIAAYNERAT